MDLGSIFLVLGLLILVALFVGRPFLERTSQSVSKDDHEYSSLLAERDRLINALMELDFDHTLGKIPEEDYAPQRTLLMERGADVLKKLDVMQAVPGSGDAETRLEAAIATRRADAAREPQTGRLQPALNGAGVRILPARPDDDLETAIASRRRERHGKAAGFCPGCGLPVQKSDKFCPKCGTKVGE